MRYNTGQRRNRHADSIRSRTLPRTADDVAAGISGQKLVGVAEIEDTHGCWVITHTEVDPAYGGQGIARRLIEEIVAEARRAGKKIVPLCSYADKIMTGKEEYRDVL